MIVRLVMLAILALFVYAAWQMIGDIVRARARRSGAQPGPRSRAPTAPSSARYEWDRRIEQFRRQLKHMPQPEEDRDAIRAFVDSHGRVDAYIEPRTAISPLSVVLIDEAGEWKRFPLKEDAFIRQLAATRGLRVYDTAKVGYPERMRRRPGASGRA